MLPHVEEQQRREADGDVALLIVELDDDQTLSDRVPREDGPAGALDGVFRGGLERRLAACSPIAAIPPPDPLLTANPPGASRTIRHAPR